MLLLTEYEVETSNKWCNINRLEEVKENPSKVLFRVQSGIRCIFWHTTLEALKQSLKACMLNFLTLPNW